jgi:uncharacterized SAM-binding protein YcdF (DUF218 family)
MHMPRAMAIARKLKWPMTPWPSDYYTAPRSAGEGIETGGSFDLLDYAVHEWIGILAYRLSGKAS